MSTYQLEWRVAQALAREAGHRMVRERREHLDIELKGTHDLVTNVDRSIERFVTDELQKLFPQDHIHGEEQGSSAQTSPEGRTWFVDPIDGTMNFAVDVPLYCVSIALQVEGQSVVGAIYEPHRDELFSAMRGHGAWLNARPLSVSKTAALQEAVLVTGFPAKRTREFDLGIEQFARLTRLSRGVRRLGSAAIDLAYVAAGRLDAFWEYGLNPWDTAAGYLMVEEAGGKVTDLVGAPYHGHGPHLLASNGRLHGAVVEAVRDLV